MFADNQRISHRQMGRQMILSLLVPILLCLPGTHHILGANGLLGILVNFVLYYFIIILLIRIAPSYQNVPKFIALLYMIPLILTGAYLLATVSRLVCTYLITGVPRWLVGLLILTVCATGSHMGLEKRGRIGEVSCGLVLGGFVLLYVLACFQGNSAYLNNPVQGSFRWEYGLDSTYGIFCALSFLGFLPFLLSKVSKPNSSGTPIFSGVLILGGMLGAALVLSQAVFGWERLIREQFPILPLMAGTNLPGDVLARFDVLWIALVVYGLFFSLGSIFFYGSHIMEKSGLHPLRIWLLLLVYGAAMHPFDRYQIEEWFGRFLMYGITPLIAALTLYVAVCCKGRGKGGTAEK
ncbi:MAG: GerAB/ArcD/ProY family transporter [Lachnospiraceae bacterium]|nr:GerAB/ArcD/ProY family transporter [Lachnospiraceae bacterium]